MSIIEISAKITGIKYLPFLCRELSVYKISDLNSILYRNGAFLLDLNEKNQIAVSWWVSPKRTRSYPYARVYDTLCFQGKKVTIIPVMKDEGRDGDRDFLQWDTISLMSLLGVYTIISYYATAEKSSRYEHKIVNQRFDMNHIVQEINKLLKYQSDALHWNLDQIEKVGEITKRALNSYEKISKELRVEMHSKKTAQKRVEDILKSKETFLEVSRDLAKKAQKRESLTIQPKENIRGLKAILTIENYLGGCYFFTCDEIMIEGRKVYLIESKHSKHSIIPSLEDIKDGLIKMILFTNLRELKIRDTEYIPVPTLKLTGDTKKPMKKSHVRILELLNKEADENKFNVLVNDKILVEVNL